MRQPPGKKLLDFSVQDMLQGCSRLAGSDRAEAGRRLRQERHLDGVRTYPKGVATVDESGQQPVTKITYIDSFGEARTIEAEDGTTVMEAAIRNAIPEITAECGGGCACATCHVYVGEAWLALTGKPSDKEEDMLDFAYKVQPNSRLSCQIKVTPELEGMIVTTPDRQG